MAPPAPGQARSRRTWPQRLLITFNVCVIVASLLVAGGIGYLYTKVSSIGRVNLGSALTPEATADSPAQAQNILIVGTDSAEGLDPKDPVVIGRPGGIRSDVIMVLRIDPASDQAKLLSFPRDLYIPIAGTKGRDRINAAIQAGPERLVQTIKADFGIPINHYVQLNWLAFRDVVAAVDGVPMYFDKPLRDVMSGLDIPEPGCVTLDGVQALAFARSRALQYKENGRWIADGTGDLGRISRQQVFIRRVIQRAIDRGARNPVVLNDLIDTITQAVHLDATLTPNDLVALGRRFKDFNPDNLDTYSVPTSSKTIGGAAYELLDTQEAEALFEMFRGAGDTDPAGVSLIVQNGSPTSNLASAAAADLGRLGFKTPPQNIGDADSFDYERTTIRYNRGDEPAAQLLASYLPSPPVFEAIDYPLGGVINLIVGADWNGVLSAPRPADVISTTTTTARGAPATSSTTVPSTAETTATTIGVVPQTPPDVNC